jgi:hypothetical protein
VRLTLERVPRLPSWPRWAVAVTVAWLGLVWLGARYAPHAVTCPFRSLTGHPCPSCGLTRGFTAIAHGDLARGLAHNPLVLGVMLLLLAALGLRLVLGRVPRLRATRRERRISLAVFLLLIAFNWVYVLKVDRPETARATPPVREAGGAGGLPPEPAR